MSIDKLKKIIKINEDENKKSSDEVRIRQLIADEYNAIKSYQQFADESENPDVKKVFLDIKNEEIIHAGELEALLVRIGVEDKAFLKKGAREVKKLLKSGEPEEKSEEPKLPVVKPLSAEEENPPFA